MEKVLKGWIFIFFQGKRPSLMNIPDEIIPILESCWAEDSKARLEFKEITILLEKMLNNICLGSSDDTMISEDQGAYEDEMEDLETTCLIQKPYCKLKKPKKKKKKVMNMILPFFKTFFSSKW